MKICKEKKDNRKFIPGHLYTCRGDNEVRMCVKNSNGALNMVRVEDGEYVRLLEPFNSYVSMMYVDVTDEYCLTRVKK